MGGIRESKSRSHILPQHPDRGIRILHTRALDAQAQTRTHVLPHTSCQLPRPLHRFRGEALAQLLLLPGEARVDGEGGDEEGVVRFVGGDELGRGRDVGEGVHEGVGAAAEDEQSISEGGRVREGEEVVCVCGVDQGGLELGGRDGDVGEVHLWGESGLVVGWGVEGDERGKGGKYALPILLHQLDIVCAVRDICLDEVLGRLGRDGRPVLVDVFLVFRAGVEICRRHRASGFEAMRTKPST